MKKFSTILSLLVLVFTFTNNTYSSDKSKKSFDKLKSLVGTWQSVMPDGSITKVSYKIVSNNSTIMETLSGKEDDAMVTMYHLNGKDLMMTHYCSAGNQPRMKVNTISDELNELDFNFVDVTNLMNDNDGHMTNLKMKFVDNDNLQMDWTFTKDGENTVHSFNFERVKK